jgi:ribosomal protein L11 methyltransferase
VIYSRLAVTPSEPSRREAVSAALFDAGAEGILEDGAALVVVFSDELSAQHAQRAARAVDAAGYSSVEPFDPGDWTKAWREGVRAHHVGRFVIAPPWIADTFDPAWTIAIDPAMGFGTGEHETTRITLSLLQDVVRDGDTCVDVGCGSGVLAIAAARLGARAVAIEIDPLAIGNAEENVARNGATDRVTVIEGDASALLPLLAPVHVIVANIIAPVLIEMLPVFATTLAPGGTVIVGGVLRKERDVFVAAATDLGWTLARELHEGDWWSGQLHRVTT